MTGSHVARIYKDNGDKKKLHKYDAAFYSRMSMNINGGLAGTGVLDIVADNEGLDSELHLTINGGYVVATGSTMDWAESDSRQVTMNLQFASAQNADESVIVTDLTGKVIFAYDPDKDETTGTYNRGYQGAVISCPEFQVSETYNVYVGGDVHGTEADGIYDASTVTGFSGAVRQQYTGTDVGMGGHGGGMRPGGMWPDGGADENAPASVLFYMTDKVNAFSGVTDEKEVGGTIFTDVADDAYYSKPIRWAALHIAGDVGVGVQRKAGFCVTQDTGQSFGVHPAGQSMGRECVTQIMKSNIGQSGIRQEFLQCW